MVRREGKGGAADERRSEADCIGRVRGGRVPRADGEGGLGHPAEVVRLAKVRAADAGEQAMGAKGGRTVLIEHAVDNEGLTWREGLEAMPEDALARWKEAGEGERLHDVAKVARAVEEQRVFHYGRCLSLTSMRRGTLCGARRSRQKATISSGVQGASHTTMALWVSSPEGDCNRSTVA